MGSYVVLVCDNCGKREVEGAERRWLHIEEHWYNQGTKLVAYKPMKGDYCGFGCATLAMIGHSENSAKEVVLAVTEGRVEP